MLGLQHSVGNRLVSRRILARSVALQGGLLVKAARLPFENDLEKAMPVQIGQHRAHVVAYDTLVKGVMDPINEYLSGADKTLMVYVSNLIEVIFPGQGASLKRHAHDATLLGISANNYKRAQHAYAQIDAILKGGTTANLDKWVNELIGALNNSPDNLRPGAGGTNSSIQQGLDLQPNGVSKLKKGSDKIATNLVGKNYVATALPADMDVLRVQPLDELTVWQMLTATWSKSGELHLFSSGKKLQSSDYAGMKSSTMTNANPTPLAINIPGTSDYFLFTV